jgi:hypothetical protein
LHSFTVIRPLAPQRRHASPPARGGAGSAPRHTE